jgi:hypothetical protein
MTRVAASTLLLHRVSPVVALLRPREIVNGCPLVKAEQPHGALSRTAESSSFRPGTPIDSIQFDRGGSTTESVAVSRYALDPDLGVGADILDAVAPTCLGAAERTISSHEQAGEVPILIGRYCTPMLTHGANTSYVIDLLRTIGRSFGLVN